MRYHNITKDNMLNGYGLRVVLWVAGCNHNCKECHNPITWDVYGGIPFDEEAKEEIKEELRKDYISGITFSGGDPLHPENREQIGLFVEELVKQFPTKTIWLYTGFVWEEIKEIPWIKKIDVIVDGKYQKELRNTQLHWRGSSNQRVIHVKQSLQDKQVVLLEQ